MDEAGLGTGHPVLRTMNEPSPPTEGIRESPPQTTIQKSLPQPTNIPIAVNPTPTTANTSDMASTFSLNLTKTKKSPIIPITGDKLRDLWKRRKERWEREGKANVRCGIGGVDGYLLGGGFERGVVVGVSGDLSGEGGREMARLVSFVFLFLGSFGFFFVFSGGICRGIGREG